MELEAKRFYKFLAPRTTVIVSTINREKKVSASAVSFVMPVSMNPPMLAISISRRVDMDNIKRTREFVVNVPVEADLDKVWKCSKTMSQSEMSEITKAGFTEMLSAKVLAPSIMECVAWFECLSEYSKEMGDHVLIVGSVVHATVRDDIVGKDGNIDVEKAKVLMHIGGPKFAVTDRELIVKE